MIDPENLPPEAPTETALRPAPEAARADGQVLYPDAYTWLVFVSALDIMLTWVVLYFGGREVNAIAAWVIHEFGLWGMLAYKFVLVMFVIVICEMVGRRRPQTGKRLSVVLVLISAVPVVVALSLLWRKV